MAPSYSLEELIAVADKICPEISDINYGTGEFCFNPYALELAKYIHENYPDVHQAVTSNGATLLLIDAEKLHYFHDVDISLDFPDPERHIQMRRHPLSWDWVLRSLKLCDERGIQKSLVTCVTSETSDDDIKGFLELAAKHNSPWRTNWFRKTGNGNKNKHLMLTVKRVWQIILFLVQQGIAIECMSDPLIANVLGFPEENPVDGCACGKISCRIQPNMGVTPCVYLKGERWSGGSIQQTGLDEIADSDQFKTIRNRFPDFCRDCKLGESCRGGCASRALLHTGSLDQPDDYCPYVAGPDVMEIVDEIKALNPRVVRGAEMVHHGYLCTMSFRL